MAFDLVQIRTLAQEREDENWRFREFLKFRCNLGSEELDRRVFETTRRVWAGIDCTTCANCCRELKPSFSEADIDRLARRLGMERRRFIEEYLERTGPIDENPWRTRTPSCPFLKDNRCTVYEDRPTECESYPHLYKPAFTSRTMGMIERTFTCPIVYEVMEELKKSLGFLQR
jgi:hypothetical protein